MFCFFRALPIVYFKAKLTCSSTQWGYLTSSPEWTHHNNLHAEWTKHAKNTRHLYLLYKTKSSVIGYYTRLLLIDIMQQVCVQLLLMLTTWHYLHSSTALMCTGQELINIALWPGRSSKVCCCGQCWNRRTGA